MNIPPGIGIQLARDVSKFGREIKTRQQMPPPRSQRMPSSRRRYLPSSQMTTQVESREMRETREMREMRETGEMRETEEMRETRKIRGINEEVKMIEETDEEQFRNNSDDVSIEDEDEN
jgi:hypothetical protein